jgi:uncharacterized protein (DUF1697 family)
LASVVLLRAANVGGHQTFKPSEFVRAVEPLEVVSVGAAGTFVVKSKATDAHIHREFARHLPFDPEMMIFTGAEVLGLVKSAPYGQLSAGAKPFVTALSKKPAPAPKLPIEVPEDSPWQVRVVAVEGRFAVSVRRNAGKAPVYPNEVVERRLGVSATTRAWSTFEALAKILGSQ